MSEIRELIQEQKKSNKRSRIFGYIATGIIGVLVCISIYTTKYALDAKEKATELNTSLENSLEALEEKNIELEIIKDNLKGEKEKLELIQKEYDSLRTTLLEEQNQDELWEYAKETNTIQGYADYIKIKGINNNVVELLDSKLTRTGYVQMEDSDGTDLFKRFLGKDFGINLWTPKSARSVRNGVIGKDRNSSRSGAVIIEGQPVRIIEDSLYTGGARWAKIKY